MITHKEARKKADELTFPHNMFFDDYITQQKKKDKLLELYQKSHEYIIVAFLGVKDLYNETPHYVVCQSDNEKFDSLSKEIKKILEEIK